MCTTTAHVLDGLVLCCAKIACLNSVLCKNPSSQEQKSNSYLSLTAICRMLQMHITFGLSLCWKPEQLENSTEMVSCGWEASLGMGTLPSSTQTRAKSHLPPPQKWRELKALCRFKGSFSLPRWEQWTGHGVLKSSVGKLGKSRRRLICENCEGQRVLCALDRKKVPELGWLKDRVTCWLTGAGVATQLTCRTGSDSSVSRDTLEHKKS